MAVVRKTGVLGGTFDPVHSGHIRLAEETATRLGLAEVVFIPAGHPWFKEDGVITPAEQRLEMLRLALSGREGLSISTMELERPGPSYTADTMAELRRRRGGEELYFILGVDNLKELPHWHQPEMLVSLCKLAVVPRVGSCPPDLDTLEKSLPGIKKRLVMLEGPHIDISASEIRRRVATGHSIEGMVPPEVASYIEDHRLYRRDE